MLQRYKNIVNFIHGKERANIVAKRNFKNLGIHSEKSLPHK
jgi:hypothetical protein